MDSAKSQAMNTKMPHCEDIGEAPTLWTVYTSSERRCSRSDAHTLQKELNHVESLVYTVFCRICVSDPLDSAGRKWYANMFPQPSPTPSGKLSVRKVPHASENVLFFLCLKIHQCFSDIVVTYCRLFCFLIDFFIFSNWEIKMLYCYIYYWILVVIIMEDITCYYCFIHKCLYLIKLFS